jgi:hypothetical protein
MPMQDNIAQTTARSEVHQDYTHCTVYLADCSHFQSPISHSLEPRCSFHHHATSSPHASTKQTSDTSPFNLHHLKPSPYPAVHRPSRVLLRADRCHQTFFTCGQYAHAPSHPKLACPQPSYGSSRTFPHAGHWGCVAACQARRKPNVFSVRAVITTVISGAL